MGISIRKTLAAVLVVALTSCGSRSGLLDIEEGADGSGGAANGPDGAKAPSPDGAAADAPAPDIDGAPVSPPVPQPSRDCGVAEASASCNPLRFSIGVQESCSISNPACLPLDAEGFVPFTCPVRQPACARDAGDQLFRVFALTRFGRGHFGAWCDATTLLALLGQFDLLGYLGQKPVPRVASVGYGYPCPFARAVDLGADLLQKYPEVGKLAADWDVLVLCGWKSALQIQVRAAWASTLDAFVRDYGKGVLAVMDYAAAGSSPSAFNEMNAITGPAGIVFDVVDLGHATMSVDASCVADLPARR
jgi:hypothetical protein